MKILNSSQQKCIQNEKQPSGIFHWITNTAKQQN